jgi:hypothetical protein
MNFFVVPAQLQAVKYFSCYEISPPTVRFGNLGGEFLRTRVSRAFITAFIICCNNKNHI